MVSWNELLASSPELAEMKADAESIAVNESRSWYEHWLPTSTLFAQAVGKAANRLGVPLEDVWPVALQGLIDCYRTAKQRLQRKGQGRRHVAAP